MITFQIRTPLKTNSVFKYFKKIKFKLGLNFISVHFELRTNVGVRYIWFFLLVLFFCGCVVLSCCPLAWHHFCHVSCCSCLFIWSVVSWHSKYRLRCTQDVPYMFHVSYIWLSTVFWSYKSANLTFLLVE